MLKQLRFDEAQTALSERCVAATQRENLWSALDPEIGMKNGVKEPKTLGIRS
jgi:hypothetical protein